MATHIATDDHGRMVATRTYPHVRAVMVADSIADDVRLVTIETEAPRWILAEINTHRVLSKSSQSSRAVPLSARIREVSTNPVMPCEWRAEQRGMEAGEELPAEVIAELKELAMEEAQFLAHAARRRAQLGLHRQWAARGLEHLVTVRTVWTGTEWDNLLALRLSPSAQPEFRELAHCIAALLEHHQPTGRYVHTPYAPPELCDADRALVSAARCARVSYWRSDGRPSTVADDLALAWRLLDDGHMSPFEHIATLGYVDPPKRSNFREWSQLRKHLPGERVHGSSTLSAERRWAMACAEMGLLTAAGARP